MTTEQEGAYCAKVSIEQSAVMLAEDACYSENMDKFAKDSRYPSTNDVLLA